MTPERNGHARRSSTVGTVRFFERYGEDELRRFRTNLNQLLQLRERQYGLFAAETPEPPTTAITLKRDTPAVDMAATLSPSQVRCYLECGAKWYYRHALKLPEQSTAFFLVGRAVHQALEQNFRQKIETGQDLETGEVLETYAAAFESEAEGTDFAADDDIDELRQTGARLTELFMRDAAPRIRPAGVEERVSGEIAGVRVTGYVDLRDTEGRIIDVKTAAKKPSCIEPGYAFQLATYRRLHPESNGQAKLITITKTKTPALYETEYTVSEADMRQTEAMYPRVQAAIRGGQFLPHRGSTMCSRKYCSFWATCEAEFGGRVKGED